MLGAVVADASWGRLRAEAEFTSGKNDIQNLSLTGTRRERLIGRKPVTTMMLNAAYDTPKIWDRVRFTVGAGAAVMTTTLSTTFSGRPQGSGPDERER